MWLRMASRQRFASADRHGVAMNDELLAHAIRTEHLNTLTEAKRLLDTGATPRPSRLARLMRPVMSLRLATRSRRPASEPVTPVRARTTDR